jgi:hypothetical protein
LWAHVPSDLAWMIANMIWKYLEPDVVAIISFMIIKKSPFS